MGKLLFILSVLIIEEQCGQWSCGLELNRADAILSGAFQVIHLRAYEDLSRFPQSFLEFLSLFLYECVDFLSIDPIRDHHYHVDY